MSKVIRFMPELMGDEQVHAAQLMSEMSEEQAMYFANVYRQRRRDETVTLIMALAGFLGVAGVHRFYLGQIGMGLLYFFTYGFCLIGTIIDLFNHRNMTADYNMRQADNAAHLVAGAFPKKKQLADPPRMETPPVETRQAEPAKNAPPAASED